MISSKVSQTFVKNLEVEQRAELRRTAPRRCPRDYHECFIDTVSISPFIDSSTEENTSPIFLALCSHELIPTIFRLSSTSQGCTMGTSGFYGQFMMQGSNKNNCDARATDSQGCGVRSKSKVSYGPACKFTASLLETDSSPDVRGCA